jgi:hypothetical protein
VIGRFVCAPINILVHYLGQMLRLAEKVHTVQ